MIRSKASSASFTYEELTFCTGLHRPEIWRRGTPLPPGARPIRAATRTVVATGLTPARQAAVSTGAAAMRV